MLRRADGGDSGAFTAGVAARYVPMDQSLSCHRVGVAGGYAPAGSPRPEAATDSSGWALRVRGLTYKAGDRALIDGIDLDMTAHGVTAIMGHNGAGKSLLIQLLHGLLAPCAGAIEWHNPNAQGVACPRQAMVFQKPVLLRRSVAANIDFAMTRGRFWRRTDPVAADRRDALLARVGLLDKAGQPARRLSGGEQQRLALARALATQPDVLFLDEPTASLDPASTALIEEVVRELAGSGMKIALVTHDIAQARRLSDDVVFMRSGRVTEHTGAKRFFQGPTSAAAAAYLNGRLCV